MVREEILELLRTDQAFREELRRQLLTDDLLALPARFDELTELVRETVGAVRVLTEAQQRTEEALQRQGEQIQRQGEQIQALTEAQQQTERALLRTAEEIRELVNWQRGEIGRRDGERYERETIRRAFALFHGGQGGSPDQLWVQQRLAERLEPLLAGDMFEAEADPFLADLIWWKGEQIAVVEISLQVNGYDVQRAARWAETLRRAGAQAVAVVIGKDWASLEDRVDAKTQQVEWKVGSDLSEGFLTFRRTSSG